MQNVLSTIEHKIDNEVRYSLHFKVVAAQQIAKIEESEIPGKTDLTPEEKQDYHNEIKSSIEKKYQNLIKNAHQYLSYMYLLGYNYSKCISHGKKLLAIDGCAQ